ncbi:DUF523 domain-containing protein [Microbulbifer sp. JMSA004]|uniref:DUF523 domain-containing protein n=1 Tax=unclassified Microbulbifer TaxID=2619833 RepID=UPI0024AE2C9E|nr:DUF523 domain-containing protein [Microbulbifer sp. VAAF005]WHI44486.1 DUF523 domain-containing protein [Microbulbifer sp. VAAF005]
MAKILVSSCLLGCAVRYNGSHVEVHNNHFDWIIETQEIVPLCPEVVAGLPVPRVPAEISGGRGVEVLAGSAKVLGINNEDLTEQFIRGAKRALQLCLQHNIKYAVLTENSPSCGSDYIYDGSFSGAKIVGSGVVSALLKREGIQVFNQNIVGRLRKLLEVSRDK